MYFFDFLCVQFILGFILSTVTAGTSEKKNDITHNLNFDNNVSNEHKNSLSNFNVINIDKIECKISTKSILIISPTGSGSRQLVYGISKKVKIYFYSSGHHFCCNISHVFYLLFLFIFDSVSYLNFQFILIVVIIHSFWFCIFFHSVGN